jgi:hypothetical protein
MSAQGQKVDEKLIPMLTFPRLVAENILQWLNPADLSNLACYLKIAKDCKEKASLLLAIAKLSPILCRIIDAKLIPMLMGLHGLPPVVLEMILDWLRQAELSALVWYLGPVERCEEKASLLHSIARVSQLKTYELALPPKNRSAAAAGLRPPPLPPALWGKPRPNPPPNPAMFGRPTTKPPNPAMWGRPATKPHNPAMWEWGKQPNNPRPPPYSGWGNPSPPKPTGAWGRQKKNQRFVVAKRFPHTQRTVGPRGLDNRPAWITRGKDEDFFLVGTWGLPGLWYEGGDSRCY